MSNPYFFIAMVWLFLYSFQSTAFSISAKFFNIRDT